MSDPKKVICGRCQEENDVESDDEEFVRCLDCNYQIPLMKTDHACCPRCKTVRKKRRNGRLANYCKCGYKFNEG